MHNIECTLFTKLKISFAVDGQGFDEGNNHDEKNAKKKRDKGSQEDEIVDVSIHRATRWCMEKKKKKGSKSFKISIFLPYLYHT